MNYIRHLRFFLFLPALIVAAAGCEITDGQEFFHTYRYHLQPNASVAVQAEERTHADSTLTVYDFSVEEGQSLVFRYEHIVDAPDNVVDGGSRETLVFQVPADSTRFEYRGKAIARHAGYFRRSCFCEFAGDGFPVTGGTLSGQQLSIMHWIIEGDVTVRTPGGSIDIQFREPFYVNL